jgi:transposase-like protein
MTGDEISERYSTNGSASVSEYARAYDRLRGAHDAWVRQLARRFGVHEESVTVSLRKAWGIPEWQRRIGKTRKTPAEGYAAEFEKLEGDPHQRIQDLARKHNVNPRSMSMALKRYWGVEKYRDLIPWVQRPTRSKEYEKAFERSRSDPWKRVPEIAEDFGVLPMTVKNALIRLWGVQKYREEINRPRLTRGRLLTLLNNPRRSKSAILAVARELGIKPESLRSKLTRWGIRKTPNGYILVSGKKDLFSEAGALAPRQKILFENAKRLFPARRRTENDFSQRQKLAAVKALEAGIPASRLRDQLGITLGRLYSWRTVVRKKAFRLK